MQNPPDSLSSLCRKVMDFQPKYVTEDYYFPLTVSIYEYNEYGDLDYDSDCELDGRFADNYADEIKAMFDAYTASDDTDMAEYFDGSNSAVAKIKSLKWDFESFDGVQRNAAYIRHDDGRNVNDTDQSNPFDRRKSY